DRYGHQADGREPSQRVEAAGYEWCMVAENIGWQYDSRGFDTASLARRLVDGWEKSPPHRANMLDKRPRDIGIATAQSPRSGRHYGVQLFARPCAAQR
ncbi:MAG TPA: CAP domain-containing protein, partial [Rubrivivax sp.]|nr:CAP domain-containing protein [Rubrivivax sp.]